MWQVSTSFNRRQIFEYQYDDAWRSLWGNIRNPFRTIRDFGAKDFLLSEVVPWDFDPTHQQYFPNYGLHLIGGGMQSRKMEEWYACHGYPMPRAWSVATMAAQHVLNEVVESGPNPALSVDNVADLYIFDPLGIILFTSDGVCRFFSEKLHMAEWPLQPSYDLATGALENMGQYYILKIPVTRDGRWAGFARGGLHEMAGVSRNFAGNRCISVAAGAGVENIIVADRKGPGTIRTAEWMWSAAAFYDINNSLLASLTLTGMPQDRVKVNIYPGLLRMGSVSPGLWFGYASERFLLGIQFHYIPMGISASHGKD